MKVAFQTWDTYLPFTLEEVTDESGTTVGDLRAMYNRYRRNKRRGRIGGPGRLPDRLCGSGDSYYHLNYTNGTLTHLRGHSHRTSTSASGPTGS